MSGFGIHDTYKNRFKDANRALFNKNVKDSKDSKDSKEKSNTFTGVKKSVNTTIRQEKGFKSSNTGGFGIHLGDYTNQMDHF